MATWKKVIVSGSSADLSALSLDTALPVASGGTGAATLTDGGVLLGSGTGAITALGQATNGQLIVGSTGADPVLATLTGGSNITVTNTAGAISIAATGLGSGTVQTVSATGTENGLTLTSDGDTVDPTITLGGALANVTNAQLSNSAVTVGTTAIALGASSTTLAGLTDVKATSFTGSFSGDGSNLTGVTGIGTTTNALTDGNGIADFTFNGSAATSIAVEAADTTIAVGASGISVVEANLSGIPNSALTNNSVTLGSTSVALGATAASLAGLTTVTATSFSGSFNGDFTGDASLPSLDTGDGLIGGPYDGGIATSFSVMLDGDTLSKANTGLKVSDYGITANQISSSVAGAGLSGGSGSAFSVNYGSSANTAAEGDTTVSFLGTTNEIALSVNTFSTVGAGGSVTIGLPDDVTITQDASIGRDLVVARNLTVQGTASFASTTDLDVADRFIRMASGSIATGDGGIVVQQTGPTDGEAFAYDSAQTRWGVTGSYDPATNSITPDAFMSAVVIGTAGDLAAGVVAKYQKSGNMFVSASGDVYIYS